MTIHPVIMCGGAGTRLWPVSNQACPKQFHRLVSDKSVFQETVLRFHGQAGFHPEPVIIS
ncbi:MAG: mannose-1-phosphate guanylyltransferase, partial [Hyphomonas sp.]|uniref:sugar phosphate nucleotidyltransferase n=2 Tax=Hyphomonas sp. TaxID=87 RepID=UPI0018197AB8|nr:mannose-1-phosphate guanylyltransferase [Hyphomonas sp.]MBU4062683.1 mannose-1-phosphate guanylyltransferase [Alphaproteobacteria bacterium]MBU4166191.1 mannose-1-phosphate guanylyltransferase [Alphaproteobacteria bacterium]